MERDFLLLRDALQKFRAEWIGDPHAGNQLAVLHVLGNEQLAPGHEGRGDQQGVPPPQPRLVLNRPGLDRRLRIERSDAPGHEMGQESSRRLHRDAAAPLRQNPIALI